MTRAHIWWRLATLYAIVCLLGVLYVQLRPTAAPVVIGALGSCAVGLVLARLQDMQSR